MSKLNPLGSIVLWVFPLLLSANIQNVMGDCNTEGDMSQMGDVTELDAGNFNSELAKYQFALVLFCGTKCPACLAMWEGYKTAASTLLANQPPVNLFMIKCDKDESNLEFCLSVNISLYPTMNVYKLGNWQAYYKSTDRSPEKIVSYMQYHAKHHYRPPKDECNACKCGCPAPCTGGSCGCP